MAPALYHALLDVVLFLPLFWWGKKHPRLLFLFLVCHAAFLTIHAGYFNYFHTQLLLQTVFDLHKESGIALRSIAVAWEPSFLLFWIDIPVAILLLHLDQKKYRQLINQRKIIFLWLASLVLAVAWLIGNYNYQKYLQRISVTLDKQVEWIYPGSRSTTYWFGLGANFFLGSILAQKEEPFLAQLQSQTPAQHPVTQRQSGPLPNLVFIQLESFDANLIQYAIGQAPLTPYLNKLATTVRYYPSVTTIHGIGGTSDPEFASLNGIAPLVERSTFNLRNYNYPHSLPHVLAPLGYQSYAYHGNVGEIYNRLQAYPQMGFHRFYDKRDLAPEQKGDMLHDSLFALRVLDSIAHLPTPFLSMVITLTSHAPFEWIALNGREPKLDQLPESLVKHYFQSVLYTDHCVQALAEGIRQRIPNTIIVLYGDHTPGRLSLGDWHTALHKESNTVVENVPLFLIDPDTSYTYPTIHHLLDLYPAIVQRIQANIPPAQ